MGEARVGKRAEQKRRWDRENKPACPGCGAEMASRRSATCRKCERSSHAARREEIRRVYLTGMPVAQMAELFGLTRASMGAEITRMRNRGMDLPYRRQPSKR